MRIAMIADLMTVTRYPLQDCTTLRVHDILPYDEESCLYTMIPELIQKRRSGRWIRTIIEAKPYNATSYHCLVHDL